MAVSEADVDTLGADYTTAVFRAQMERTPASWMAVGKAWGRYFDGLMVSRADDHPNRKAAVAGGRAWLARRGGES